MLLNTWQQLSRSGTETDRQDAEPTAALLTDFRVLRFSGSDVLGFLQGYLTIDTAELQVGRPRLTALTNLKGRVVADGWCVLTRPETLDWVVHESLVEPVAGFLHRYLAFSRTTLSPREDDNLVAGVMASDAPPTVTVLADEADIGALLDTHAVVPDERWRQGCVDARLALVSLPTSEAFLPQMLGLVDAGAVDFDKGCYLGQEVVARAQHRGEVKRGLVRLQGPGPALTAGAELRDDAGRPAGTVITAAATGDGQRCLAVTRLPSAAAYRSGTLLLNPY